MSMTGTWSPASATTSSRVPTAATVPSSMRRASATGGSSMVTIRPTMTRLPVLAAGGLGATEMAGEALAVEVGDDGELALLGLQPATTASTTRAADNVPNLPRDAVMGQPASRGRRRAARPGRPRIDLLAELHRTEDAPRIDAFSRVSTNRSDPGSRSVQIRSGLNATEPRGGLKARPGKGAREPGRAPAYPSTRRWPMRGWRAARRRRSAANPRSTRQ